MLSFFCDKLTELSKICVQCYATFQMLHAIKDLPRYIVYLIHAIRGNFHAYVCVFLLSAFLARIS